MTFASDLKKFSEKTNANMNQAVRVGLFAMNDSAILGTPVDSGQARGGWIASIASPSGDIGQPDKSGRSALDNANVKASIAPGNVYYLTNNVKYIGVLEFGGYPNPPEKGSYIKKSKSYEILSAGGFSKQAPNGMARIAAKVAVDAIHNFVNSVN